MGARFSPVVERPDAGASDPRPQRSAHAPSPGPVRRQHLGPRHGRTRRPAGGGADRPGRRPRAPPRSSGPAGRARLPRRLAARLHDDRPRARAGDTTTYAAEFTRARGHATSSRSRSTTRGTRPTASGGGDNIPLVLAAPATLRFTYDDTTHAVGVAPDRPARARLTAADATLAAASLRDLATQRALLLRHGRPVRQRRHRPTTRGGLDRRPARAPASTRPTRASTTAATSRA